MIGEDAGVCAETRWLRIEIECISDSGIGIYNYHMGIRPIVQELNGSGSLVIWRSYG